MNDAEKQDPWDSVRVAIIASDFHHATFAGACRGVKSPWQRVAVRVIELRGQRTFQFSYFDGKKTFTENHVEPLAAIQPLIDAKFAGVHIEATSFMLDVRTTKKGHTTISRKAQAREAIPLTPHNRIKDVPLPEGREDRLLEIMGIASAEGVVKPTMRAKFTQINEFLQQLKYCLEPADLLKLNRPLRVLDCGCGSSYLTIAAHHYLNEVLQLPAELIGVDVNEEVIRKSIARKTALGAAELNFACARIGTADIPADIVFALHACNTATDDALAQGIRSRARLILSVPCCHHEVNSHFKQSDPPANLHAIFRHGILRERTADIITDTCRAAALRIAGYRTDVIEFISPEHTSRNLMIRAVYTGKPDATARHEYEALKTFAGITPAIEKRLPELFAQSSPLSPSS